MTEHSKWFPTEGQARNFISWMQRKNPHCKLSLHSNMDRTSFYVHWDCDANANIPLQRGYYRV